MIQWEEGKIRQPKRYKDDLYAEIRCQVSPHAIRQIQKQVEKSRDALDKNIQLPPCTESFWETIALPCAHEIHWCIYEKTPIPIESIHWHWQFDRDPDWDSRKDKDVESDADSLSQNASLPGTPLHENRRSTTSSSEVPIFLTNATSTESPYLTQNPMSLGNSSFTHSPPVNLRLPLDPRLQEIEEPVAVTLRGRLSGSLNKKRSRNNDTLDRSTRREPSRFEHVERNFSSSQRGVRRSGIRGNAVRRGQNQSQNRPQNRSQSRADQSTSGNITGIPTEMTSVFSI